MAENEKDLAIKVEHLTKSFRIPLESSNGIKQKIINTLKGRKGYRVFTPLNDISFEIEKGEFFGIVGRNGSGKSTLLKSIAGIYTTESGKVHVNGKLVPFIELGVGFNAELTGRENVFLNGALLGFSNKEMEAMYDEIVDFAELHDFMEERLKNYSSGMQVRLAFSIAIRAKGDVLLLDEVLAVGDSAFQQKCYSYFRKLKENGQTVILVTHSMAAVERFCTRALLLDEGNIVKIGDSQEIAAIYEDMFLDAKKQGKKQDKKDSDDEPADNLVEVNASIERNEQSVQDVKFGEKINIIITLNPKITIRSGNLGINIRNESGYIVFSSDTRPHINEFRIVQGERKIISYQIDNKYTNGDYTVDIHVVDEASDEGVLGRFRSIVGFTSRGVIAHSHSLFHPEYEVREIDQDD